MSQPPHEGQQPAGSDPQGSDPSPWAPPTRPVGGASGHPADDPSEHPDSGQAQPDQPADDYAPDGQAPGAHMSDDRMSDDQVAYGQQPQAAGPDADVPGHSGVSETKPLPSAADVAAERSGFAAPTPPGAQPPAAPQFQPPAAPGYQSAQGAYQAAGQPDPGQPAQGNPEQSNPGQSSSGQPNPDQPGQQFQQAGYQGHPYGQGQAGYDASGQPVAGQPAGNQPASGQPGTGQPGEAAGYAAPISLQQAAPGRGRSRWGNRLLMFSAMMLAALVAGYVGSSLNRADRPLVNIPVQSSGGGGGESRPSDSVAGIAAEVLPSVIAIETRSRGGQSGTGSGFVLRSEGYILTNNHVVADVSEPDEISVVFEDGSRAGAELVGRSVSYDLAVLKVDRQGLVALPLGDSDEVVVGDGVIAVGAPLGLQSTVTTGIVSAKNRPVSAGRGSDSAFINAIQTDAAINPGNSGGPLLDASGRVIGINSAIAHIPGRGADASGSIGLGFAIPSKQAARTAEQLINNGEATYPIVGILLDSEYRGEGVKIVETGRGEQAAITPDSPADRAGIKPGDVVLKYQGRPLNTPDELIVAIRAQEPGDTVEWTIRSGGEDRTVSLTLDQSKVDS